MDASRDKPAKPNRAQNGNFVTSGEIGTNTMHLPGKRSIGVNINININININRTVSIHAGGHSGPPLRRGFV